MITSDFLAPVGLLHESDFPEVNAATLVGAWLSQAGAQIIHYVNDGLVLSTEKTVLEGVVFNNETDALTAAFVYWRAYEYLCHSAAQRPVSVSAGSTSVRYGDASINPYCGQARTFRNYWFNGTGQGDLLAMY